MIEDRTGSATIQLYFTLLHFTLLFIQLDNSLTQVESGNTYSFQNLSVKNYSGMTLLGTTPTTTFQKVDLQLTEVKGPQLLSNTEKEIVIQEFKFVDKENGMRDKVLQEKKCRRQWAQLFSNALHVELVKKLKRQKTECLHAFAPK